MWKEGGRSWGGERGDGGSDVEGTEVGGAGRGWKRVGESEGR